MHSDEQAIRANQQEWLAATASGDLDRLLRLMADDVVFLTPGRPPFGKQEFASAFAAGQQQKMRFQGNAELEEVVVAGDVAYARGKLSVTVAPAGGEAKRLAGYTLSVFLREADGRWVLARDANLMAPVAG